MVSDTIMTSVDGFKPIISVEINFNIEGVPGYITHVHDFPLDTINFEKKIMDIVPKLLEEIKLPDNLSPEYLEVDDIYKIGGLAYTCDLKVKNQDYFTVTFIINNERVLSGDLEPLNVVAPTLLTYEEIKDYVRQSADAHLSKFPAIQEMITGLVFVDTPFQKCFNYYLTLTKNTDESNNDTIDLTDFWDNDTKNADSWKQMTNPSDDLKDVPLEEPISVPLEEVKAKEIPRYSDDDPSVIEVTIVRLSGCKPPVYPQAPTETYSHKTEEDFRVEVLGEERKVETKRWSQPGESSDDFNNFRKKFILYRRLYEMGYKPKLDDVGRLARILSHECSDVQLKVTAETMFPYLKNKQNNQSKIGEYFMKDKKETPITPNNIPIKIDDEPNPMKEKPITSNKIDDEPNPIVDRLAEIKHKALMFGTKVYDNGPA